MRYLSLFSGIEAASVAWHPFGWECAAVSEIEPFPCAVLAHHYPNVPNLGDVTKVTEQDIKNLGRIDLVVFGSPCQDLSVAGKRKGLDGERSGLFFTAINIIRWARKHCGCRFALWENVPGAFSSNAGRDFAAVVGEMAGCRDVEVPRNGWGNEGCAVGEDGMVEWSVLDAQWFGVAQRRRRVFALADFGDWPNRPPVLLERRSLRRDSAPSREKGQEAAGTLDASLGRSRGAGTHPGAIVSSEVAPTLRAQSNASHRPDTEAYVAQSAICMAHGQGGAEVSVGRSPTLTCNHEAPIVVHGTQDPCVSDDQAFALGRNSGQENALCVSLRGRAGGATAELGGDLCPTIRAAEGGGSKPHVLTSMAVRRLTPRECEFLQGFPRNYTLIPWRGKPATDCPDGPRYKALGNSMAVPCMAFIGSRIQIVLTGKQE